MIQAMIAMVAMLLLDGDAGKGGKGGEGGGFEPPGDDARKYMSDLIDERINAAFERWLEKTEKEQGEAGKPAPAPPAGDGNPPARKPSFLETVFGLTR